MRHDLHRRIVPALAAEQPSLRFRFGSVVSVESDYSCTVTIGGGADSVAGVPYVSGVAPLPGAGCILATDGSDLFVIEVLAAADRTISPRASRSTTQSITTSNDTPVTFDGVNGDSWGCWSSGSATRLTAPLTGRYQATAVVSWAGNATGFRSIWIERNGTSTVGRQSTLSVGAGNPTWMQVTSQPFDMAKGDYLRLIVWQNSGGSLNVNNSSTFAPSLSFTYLGP